MSNILDLTKENIQQVVDASMKHIVVMGFASKQQPESLAYLQLLETIAADNTQRFILAKVDCDSQMEIAQYFQIQALPTTLIMNEGQPIDGFAGVKERGEVVAALEKHLPAMWQLNVNHARAILAKEDKTAEELTQALEFLTDAYKEQQTAEVALPLADVCLLMGDNTQAETLLATIGLADKDSYYQSLMAKLDLAKDAANTPEIRALQDKFDADPNDGSVTIDLAKAMHQVQRNEEALELLFAVLKHDMNAENGEVKRIFMEILTAIGQGNVLANQYRRRLYTLLY
ncbi:MAG: co-chaperone YbbN [Parashewanella sp.]